MIQMNYRKTVTKYPRNMVLKNDIKTKKFKTSFSSVNCDLNHHIYLSSFIKIFAEGSFVSEFPVFPTLKILIYLIIFLSSDYLATQ